MKIEIKNLPNSHVEIIGELAWANVEKYHDKVLKSFSETMEVDGFRKGHVPTNIVLEKVPEIAIIQEMAEYAINEAYPNIVKENNIDAIGAPEVFFTKIAKGSDIGYTIKTAVIPNFELPDYKKIIKEVKEKMPKEEKTGVGEAEISNTLHELQNMRAHQNVHKDGGHDEHDHSHAPIEEKDLPELNDEFAKSFGFENLIILKEKIVENLNKEKENKDKEKIRIQLVDALISSTEVGVPDLLIDSELSMVLHRMKHDVMMMGISFEDYLKHQNKTEDDLKKDYRQDARKRVIGKLILEKIGLKENLNADKEKVEIEVRNLTQAYPDADKNRTVIYVEEMLKTEAVLSFLENC